MATIHPKLSEERSQTVVSSTKSVKLKIKRSNPNVNSDEQFDDPADKHHVVRVE